jgi:peptide methionine sulfoxide reductase msrA/msrB
MKAAFISIAIALLIVTGYQSVNSMNNNTDAVIKERAKNSQLATFAGGCFWCTESDFEKVKGVLEVVSGYTGGRQETATYQQVSAGRTRHLEAVQVRYNPAEITYGELLDIFWRHVDPTDPGGQFVDRGAQYRSAIFYHDEEQRRFAEESKAALDRSGRFDKAIVTEIIPLEAFYPAEDYHQDYYKKIRCGTNFTGTDRAATNFLKRHGPKWTRKYKSNLPLEPIQYPMMIRFVKS